MTRDFVNLSVVIVTYQSRNDIGRCIKSIYEGTQGLTCEIIIVDNGSADGSTEFVGTEFPGVKIIQNKNNEGFSKAINQGAGIACGKYLCILNPDTELYPKTLPVLLNFLEEHPSVDIVGPRAVDGTGKVIPSCRSLPHLGNISRYLISSFLNGSGLSRPRRFLLDIWKQDRTIELSQYKGYLTGTCFITRLDFFKEAGLLDEHFFLYYEDADFGLHILQRKGRVFFVSESCLVHFLGHSTIQNPLTPIHNVESYLYYIRKNFDRAHGAIYRMCFLCLILVWTAKAWVKGEHRRLPVLKKMLKSFAPHSWFSERT